MTKQEDQSEREIIRLEIENELLKFEKLLPPAPPTRRKPKDKN
jgi:hypothetical protein